MLERKLVLGTQNQGKISEFRALFAGANVTLLSWKDFDYRFSVNEDGETFQENALKKAEVTARITGEVSIADDSGLEVDFLNGRPGVRSARYGGLESGDVKNYAKLLEELEGVPPPQRGARFLCVLVVFAPDGRWEAAEGECQGVITESPRGISGFGYDPVFLVPTLGKTFAEIGAEEKNRISHRARAVNKLLPLLGKYFPLH